MPQLSPERTQKLQSTFHALYQTRQDWWPHWRELADYYLPRRYVWLLSPVERRRKMTKNPFILDGTGTVAARVLAAGLMNGITSPSRPWFKLRIANQELEEDHEVAVWLDEVQRRMMQVMAESNFYNGMAQMYLDLVVFGTSTMLIYEDIESVIRCFNPACGEYYLAQSARLQVNTFAREFTYKVHQLVERWPDQSGWPDHVKQAVKTGGAALMQDVGIRHIIEPNVGQSSLPQSMPFREVYWVLGAPAGRVLEERGFNEFPCIAPRWEVTANDVYGASPAMDALGDVIQLQFETKKKGQGLDKLIDPPMVADIQLQNRPSALLPRGITYIAGANNIGIKPAYQIQIPLAEMSADIMDVRQRIRETFSNDLFQMISNLDTVRSATEIDARREEKLIRLGSVLERFENEALDPAIERIFGIMARSGLLPPAPASMQETDLEVQYVSILSVAQSAVGVAPIERLLGLLGNLAPLRPEVLEFPEWDEMLRDYSRDIGVKPKNLKSREQLQAAREQQSQQIEAQQAAVIGGELVQGAKALSETDVGGGANALQQILNG